MIRIAGLVYLIWLAHPAGGQVQSDSVFNLIIGNYSVPPANQGLYVYGFNTGTGELYFKSSLSGVDNPSYLAIGTDGKQVYTVNELRDKGGVSAYDYDAASGKLTFLNRVYSGGTSPAYIATDPLHHALYVANYGNGSLSVIPIQADGSLGEPQQTIQFEGSSVHPSRQRTPHVHCVIPSPDGRYLVATDLGTDKVHLFRINPDNINAPLTRADHSPVSVKPGNGPRHVVFHPNGRFMFLISEMGGEITLFHYRKGVLSAKQDISLVPAGFTGRISAADIHVSADGRYLYASNRGDANTLILFGVGKDGTLQYIGSQSSLGKTPRNFTLDPSGRFLLVANQDSNEVVVFRRDPSTGKLTGTGKSIRIDKPSCLVFDSRILKVQ